jgi:lipid A 3-O-deacylase
VRAAVVSILATLTATAAEAQELRIGSGHSTHPPEHGASVIVEYLFPSPHVLRRLGSPRPYLSTQLSTDSYTNYIQAGLLYRMHDGRRIYFDLGGGVSLHDGELSLPRPDAGETDAENALRRHNREERIEFDQRWVFHATFALGYRLTERWAVEFEGQHWSNGQLRSETHDGVDSLGLRVAYRF